MVQRRDIKDLLRGHQFFRGLDEEALAFMAGCGMNVCFDSGTLILREGDPADRFYLLRSGRVAIEIRSPDRGPLVIDTIHEGDILGVSWLVPPYRWGFDARAMELTRAVSLDATCLRARCEEDPRLGYELMQRLARVLQRRLQSARVRLLDIYNHAGAP